MTTTTNAVRFDVLGPWMVKAGGATVAIPHGRLTVLLAALLLSIDEYVSVETLAGRLWSDHQPVHSREALHTYVTRLRKVLGRDLIETGPGGGYRLRVDPSNVDLYRFRTLLRQAREAGVVDRERRLLAGALELWRGKPFGDVESAWLDRDVVPRLTEQWLTATERRIDLDLATGPPGLVVAELWGLTSAHPARESLWFRLVVALDRAGRRADALNAYEKARAALADELGVGPSEQLLQLSGEILSSDAPTDDPARQLARTAPPVRESKAVDSTEFGKLLRAHRNRLSWTQAELADRAGVSERTIYGLELGRSRPRRTTLRLVAEALGLNTAELRHFQAAAGSATASTPKPMPTEQPTMPTPAQLPPDIGDFIGRARELSALDALLPVDTGTTIVALTGSPGAGKTALAVRWAHRVADKFPDGQLYANLRGFAPGQPALPVEVLAEFLGALGVPPGQVPPQLTAATGLYRSLLANRRILIVLDNALDADQVRPLLPGGSAGGLVLVTSRHALSGLVVSPGALHQTLAPLPPDEAIDLVTRIIGADRVSAEPDAAAALVTECLGLPLALRIASANVRVEQHLDIGGYVAELQAGDQLASLAVAGDPTASVQAAFDWSYERLSPPVQRLFRLLGLVPGPDVTPAAAAALAGTDPDQTGEWLRTLANSHLVDRSAAGRYALHDLLRTYAAERAKAVDPEPERSRAIDRLLEWYLHSTVAAAEVLAPTTLRLPTPPPSEGIAGERPEDVLGASEWLGAERRNLVAAVTYAAATSRHRPAWLLADALRGYFEANRYQVDWTTVAEAGLASAIADGDLAAQSAGASGLALLHHTGGEFGAALERVQDSLTFARQAGWSAAEARALNHLAILRAESGDLDACIELLQEALKLDRRIGDRGGESKRLTNLGHATQSAGRLREALGYMQQAVGLLGEQVHADIMLANLGHLQHHIGDFEAAEASLRRAVAACTENDSQLVFGLVQLTELCLDRGRLAEAEAHLEVAEEIAARSGHRVSDFHVTNMCASADIRLGRPGLAVERLEKLLGTAEVQKYRRSAWCDALSGLARARLQLGELDLALDNADQAIELAEADGRRLPASTARWIRADIRLARYRKTGDPAELASAAEDAEATLKTQRWMGHQVGEVRSLILLGDIATSASEPATAGRHWRAALEKSAEIGMADDETEVRQRLTNLTEGRA